MKEKHIPRADIPSSITDEIERRVVERFITYVQMNTRSDEASSTSPSTSGQLTLAKHVSRELESIGMQDVHLDPNGYLTAVLPSNTDKPLQTIGFLAHFDTSPEVSGEGVKPVFHANYQGGDLLLNPEKEIRIGIHDFPSLQQYIGHTLITSDGTTLLGADDKAGIAAIVTAMEYLIRDTLSKHGRILLCFTPDEEIGRGTNHIDLQRFNPDFAFTIDGGGIGTIEHENFNAAGAFITIQGLNVHPGYARDKMRNAISIAQELDRMLPDERPENTSEYEGFFHAYNMSGTVEQAQVEYLIRDHDKEHFAFRKETMAQIVDSLNRKYGEKTILLQLTDQYYNMHEKIEPVMEVIELAKKSIHKVGIEPLVKPIRGGTDGARLSFMGIPCPNLFAGGENFHSRYEYVSTRALQLSTLTISHIVTTNDLIKK